MPYVSFEDLLVVLDKEAPTLVAAIRMHRPRVEHGLLTVGLKLHCLDGGWQLEWLIEELGGPAKVLDYNSYRRGGCSICWVLPPVGSARVAMYLIEAIEKSADTSIFNNPEVQIQVCSPKRLGQRRAALLAIGFYLGSDRLRRYSLGDFETTFSRSHDQPRGRRIVLYDAEQATFEPQFEWWGRNGNELRVHQTIPPPYERTDILTATSRRDIENINLIATLLVHAQYEGFWRALGRKFEDEMEALLRSHMLSGLLAAPWVRTTKGKTADDELFFSALQELMACALGEAERTKTSGYIFKRKEVLPAVQPDPELLLEMQRLLQKYREEIVARSSKSSRKGGRR